MNKKHLAYGLLLAGVVTYYVEAKAGIVDSNIIEPANVADQNGGVYKFVSQIDDKLPVNLSSAFLVTGAVILALQFI